LREFAGQFVRRKTASATLTMRMFTVAVVFAATVGFPNTAATAPLPRPDHIVIVIFENKSYGQIIGNSAAPNINALAADGANFVNAPSDPSAATSGSHALRRPSQPNYLELFSDSNQGVRQNGRPGTSAEPLSLPLPFNTPNLGASLIAAGLTFATYSESLPFAGFDGDEFSTDQGKWQPDCRQPADDREATLSISLDPGNYTVVLSGKNGSKPISTRPIRFRGLGPSLSVSGVPVSGRLDDPTLELHNENGATIAFNDDWKDSHPAEVQASGLAPSHDREAVVIGNFPPGQYTAIVRGQDDTTGIALVEAYQLN